MGEINIKSLGSRIEVNLTQETEDTNSFEVNVNPSSLSSFKTFFFVFSNKDLPITKKNDPDENFIKTVNKCSELFVKYIAYRLTHLGLCNHKLTFEKLLEAAKVIQACDQYNIDHNRETFLKAIENCFNEANKLQTFENKPTGYFGDIATSAYSAFFNIEYRSRVTPEEQRKDEQQRYKASIVRSVCDPVGPY